VRFFGKTFLRSKEMTVKSIAIVAAVLFFVSSWNNSLNAEDDSGRFSIPRRAVINADCDYYDASSNRRGRLQQGQEIVFIGSYYQQRGFDVITEVARTINGEQRGTPIYVAERYITFFDGERYDFWFKNELMTREYYYTGTVEEIYANSGYGRNVREGDARALEQSIRGWRHAYSENRLCFSDNYLVIGNADDMLAYRLESVTLESTSLS
jgi:hypothetical protein